MRISLFFTSDEHGYLAGAPAIGRLVDEARRENPGRVLFLSSGDIFQGAPESEGEGGTPGLEVHAAAGYDAVEVGNHDFDNGPEFVRNWTRNAPYPVLCGNVRDRTTGGLLPGVKPWMIFNLDGVKVGLLGVLTPNTLNLGYQDKLRDFSFEDPVECAQRSYRELKAQGCEVVGALTHLEPEEDVAVAENVPLDFQLGGHKHEFREHPRLVRGVPVCQPGRYREAVGRLDLELDPVTHRVVKFEHKLIRISPSLEPDTRVGQIVQKYLERSRERDRQPVSFTDHAIEFDAAKSDEMDDAVARALQCEAGTRVSLHNQKLPRTSLNAGEVTAGELRAVVPFPNYVVRMEVSREQLLQMVEKSLNSPSPDASLHLGGLTVVPERTPEGKLRVASLQLEGGQPVPERLQVATTDFLAQGGLGYFPASNGLPPLLSLVRDALQAELTRRIR
ncbi:MAG: bifunctional metallophosphatase/5'-nucleotidase [Candidatus Eremiobacterota bacterium]